ncbi:MAG: M56 family metallopeptidase [Clostridia bacterium]|jgi:beta-lactamase regulating signal transducer with metallopeptidase domain|nr:M56 family metallopeptidase [Clostridia bacterium]
MTEFFYHILSLNIGLTPVIAALLLLMPLWGIRYAASFRYWVWLALALRLLLPFSLGKYTPFLFNVPLFPASPKLPETLSQGPISHSADCSETLSASTVFTQLTFGQIIIMLYFIVAISFLAYKLMAYALFCRRISKWSRGPSDTGIAERVSELSSIYRLKGRKTRLKIRICKKIAGPMVLGLFQQTLLLPDEEYDDEKLKMILSHEIVHIKRRDLWYKLALLLVCALHWFNPLVHIMAKRADRDLEISCDNLVLKAADIHEKKRYSMMIIEMAAHNSRSAPPALSTNFKSSKESLENRIKGIFDSGLKKSGRGAIIVIVFLLAFFGGVFKISDIPVSAANTGQPVQALPEREPSLEIKPEPPGENTAGESRETGDTPSETAMEDKDLPAQPRSAQTLSPAQPAELVMIDLEQLIAEADEE